jgi:putative ABC transport system substrate-binding protein
MSRRQFIALVGGAAAALVCRPEPIRAQQTMDRPLIGVLNPLSRTAVRRNIEALRLGLRDAGYIEGENVVLEWRFAEGVLERMQPLANEIVALNPDLIIAGSPSAIIAVHQATRTIPIVMSATNRDPIALGLAASLSRPGGNVTGFWLEGEEALTGKRLALLKDAVRGVSRIAVILNPDDPADAAALQILPEAARALGITSRIIAVRRVAEFEAAFATAVREGFHGLSVSHSPLFNSHRDKAVALATGTRLPAIYGFREFVLAGGMMSYAANLPEIYRQAAGVVDKILKGAKPADIPIERPTRFDLVVNLKSAKAMGLTISDAFLLLADEVIE